MSFGKRILRQIFLRGLIMLSAPWMVYGGDKSGPHPVHPPSVPPSVQEAARALVYVKPNPPYGLGGTGFFIDPTTMVINSNAVADVAQNLIPPVATLSFTDVTGEVSEARAVGFFAFSHTLNLAVLKVKGYEGPVLPLSSLSLEEVEKHTRHQDVYFPFVSSEGQMKIFTGQRVNARGLYHLNQYLPLSDRKGGMPVLDSEGRLVAVSDFASDEGIYTLPHPLLKKLIDTNFEWESLQSVKHLNQKVKDQDKKWEQEYARRASGGDGLSAYLRGVLAYINEASQDEWLEWYKLSSDQGYPLARFALQEAYNHKDRIKHLKSQANESPQALYRLAYFYDYNFISDKAALAAYRKLARQGHVLAQHRLARLYDITAQELKTSPDIPLSRQWYEKAARQGYALSQFMLARQKEQAGLGEEAKSWYEKAAFQGLPEAQYRLGTYYLSYGVHFFSHFVELSDDSKSTGENPTTSLSSFSREEVRKFFMDAGLRWLEKAAGSQGFVPALFALGEIYRNGWGVSPDPLKASSLHAMVAGRYALPLPQAYDVYFINKMFPQDPEAAKRSLVQYLIQLAVEGYVWASFSLGRMYERGYMVQKSVVTARKWYRKIASKGHVEAMYRLGETYRRTRVEQGWDHPREAKKWYKKAAEKGHEEARSSLQTLTILLSRSAGLLAAAPCLSLF